VLPRLQDLLRAFAPACAAAPLAAALAATLALAACGDGSGSAGDDAPPLAIIDPASVPGTVMDLAAAQNFFPPLRKSAGRMVWDEQAWVVLRPDRNQSFDWAEHPAGRITFRTNNLGLREDAPTAPRFDGLRILATGDSQTEGAVNNAESWPNALERLLVARAAGNGAKDPAVEVLNAGVGGTGPHNHLGVLRRDLPLEPDVFMAALFAGNDFQGALQISDFYSKRRGKPRSREYMARLDAGNARWPEALPQTFNQAAYFAYAPDDLPIALAAAVGVYAEMDETCREHGVRFVALVIPAKPDVEPDDDRATVDEMLATLALTREQLALGERLGRDFAAALAERGIACIDALDGLRGADVPLYWRRDHHLNVAGNARLAGVVAEGLARLDVLDAQADTR
jgi:hypothetical protein